MVIFHSYVKLPEGKPTKQQVNPYEKKMPYGGIMPFVGK
jgi:hypothetical protein